VEWRGVGGHAPDPVAATHDEPRAGGAAQALAAAEQRQVGTLLGESPEVLAGRQLCRRVDDHRHAVMAGGLDDRGEWQDVAGEVRLRDVDDGRGLRRQQRAQLATGLSPGPAAWRLPGLRAELDQCSTGQLDDGGVGDAMRPMDDELARVGLQLVEAKDAVACPAGHGGGGGQEQPGRGAARHEGRLVAGELGEAPTDRVLELDQVDEGAGRLVHRVEHLGRHERAAEDRERRPAVDDRLDAEPSIDIAGSSRADRDGITHARTVQGRGGGWTPLRRTPTRLSPCARGARTGRPCSNVSNARGAVFNAVDGRMTPARY
jgi:hypothetical protein